jgi:hypothetical protein
MMSLSCHDAQCEPACKLARASWYTLYERARANTVSCRFGPVLDDRHAEG